MAKPKDLIKRIGGEFDSATLARVEAQERRDAEMRRIARHSRHGSHVTAPRLLKVLCVIVGLACGGGLVLLFLIPAL
jgi:hypothetical protein